MSKREVVVNYIFTKLLSEETKYKSERLIILIAIISFLLHLLLILLVDFNVVQLNEGSELLSNPIAAIYTPFSFILLYEVYLLVYYLPKSITTYIGKQYEIITLIVIRRIFKDISNLELGDNWFQAKYNLQFTYDILTTIILFFLIFIFYRLNEKKEALQKKKDQPLIEMTRFIKMKQVIAMSLVPIFLVLAIYTFGRWIYESFFSISQIVYTLRDLNDIFFNEFFTILILIDVLLLLISFLHTDKFNTVIRNSGFLISTTLLRLSFGVDDFLNTLLIVTAVLFGVVILAIYNQYEKIIAPAVKQ